MSELNTTKDIDLVKIVDEVWKDNELHSGTYKVAALTAMQKLQDLYESLANVVTTGEKQCNLPVVSDSFSAEQMHQAFQDGMEYQARGDEEFDIRNYL